MKICIIADENKKETAAQLCISYCGVLCRHSVYVTGSCAGYVEKCAGISVNRLADCKNGGIEQVTQMVAGGECDIVICLRDTSLSVCDSREFSELMRFCDYYGIPSASGPVNAEIILHTLGKRESSKFIEQLLKTYSKF